MPINKLNSTFFFSLFFFEPKTIYGFPKSIELWVGKRWLVLWKKFKEKRRNAPRWIGNHKNAFLSSGVHIVIKEKYNEREYYQRQMMEYTGINGTTRLTILRIDLMLCPPNGQNEMFRQRKAFLCLVENLPFRNRIGTISLLTGYTVLGDDPWEKLTDWVEFPLEWVDENWNEADLFSKTLEEAVDVKIKDVEEIWRWTSLRTRCQSCAKKGEQCKKRLELLKLSHKSSFSFSPFSSPFFLLTK